ncbi:hypothetical protein V6N12_006876 [Hibiscus sabdariffa]|uniref:Uncharacterized protein n=1 Tax=Hibiscus sabdariffa TaxID=183260 RepID=A0ABR2F036_9ROSI
MKALWTFRGFWGVSGEVRFEIMGRGEVELHDNGFGSLMSDEALTAAVSDEPGIGSPMSAKHWLQRIWLTNVGQSIDCIRDNGQLIKHPPTAVANSLCSKAYINPTPLLYLPHSKLFRQSFLSSASSDSKLYTKWPLSIASL